MTSENERIPTVEVYRGVGIHDGQPRDRIEGIVKPALDLVFGEDDPYRLLQIAQNVQQPPEARLFAAAKIEAAFELATDERRVRPFIDLTLVRASIAGLGSRYWRDQRRYCSVLDAPKPGGPEAVIRETALDDD